MHRQLNVVRDSSFQEFERATGFRSDRLEVVLPITILGTSSPVWLFVPWVALWVANAQKFAQKRCFETHFTRSRQLS